MHIRRVIFGVVIVTLLAACGSSTGGSADASDIETKRQYDALINDVLSDEIVSEQQREALADGLIEFSELESAGLATERCISDSGLTNVQFKFNSEQDDWTFGYNFPEGWRLPDHFLDSIAHIDRDFSGISETSIAASKLFMFCERKHFEAIGWLWQWQNLLPADAREAIDTAFENCVEQLGEFDNSDKWLSQEADCWDAAQQAAS